MVAIIHVIEKYTEKYYYHVLILFVWIYILYELLNTIYYLIF